jgi:BirA family transcriptional regulator, biotin operon repressor / biotin---[acetyl-CoA-carboxylase] ligase
MNRMHCQPQPEPYLDRLEASTVLPLCTNASLGRVRYIYTPTTGSTNDDALALAAQDAPHGTLVVADEQTSGRGRQDRSWVSPSQAGIYISLLLRPDRPIQHAPLLAIAAGIAAVEAIHSVTGARAQIKWPNDILLHERKIAGILTETDISPEGRYAVVLGFGMNVNTPYTALPARVVFPASSLQIELARTTSRPLLLAAWLQHMEALCTEWEADNHAAIVTAWHRHAYGIGQNITIQQQDQTLHGELLGMDQDGALILKSTTGDISQIRAGDVASTTFGQTS